MCVVSVSRDEENRATKWEIPQSYNVQREREYSEYSFLASLYKGALSLYEKIQFELVRTGSLGRAVTTNSKPVLTSLNWIERETR